MSTLDSLVPGERATIIALGGDDATTRRLMELGLLPGACVELLGRAPLGDPLAVLSRGGRLAVRSRDARQIAVSVMEPA